MENAPLINVEENPIPENMNAYYLEGKDGARLRYATLPVENPKGTFLVHPGWSEFLEKYVEVAKDLNERGFNVYILDPRGQGYSQRVEANDDRALISTYDKFTDDLSIHVEQMKATFEGPYFLLAHSMGGLISLLWMAKTKPTDLKGAMLCAPLTQINGTPLRQNFVKWAAKALVACGIGARQISGIPEHSLAPTPTNLTHDLTRHLRFRSLQLSAPEAQAGPLRFAWINASMNAFRELNSSGFLDQLPVKTLLVSGGNDQTVSSADHTRLAAKHTDQFEFVHIDGARHEILMESDEYRDQIWAAIDDYVSKRLSADDNTYEPPGTSDTSSENVRSNNASAI